MSLSLLHFLSAIKHPNEGTIFKLRSDKYILYREARSFLISFYSVLKNVSEILDQNLLLLIKGEQRRSPKLFRFLFWPKCVHGYNLISKDGIYQCFFWSRLFSFSSVFIFIQTKILQFLHYFLIFLNRFQCFDHKQIV